MEALLPSEIARLVLGYLEDQKCTDAAKLFLETSPHLQECRTVLSHGRRFSTRVNGLTLIDVIEKLSAINAMIQERLNKVTDCEQLKHCGDLIEQLKFLVEEPRGQRFVVNINVPSQSNTQTSNGSPTITCNMRKRRHSNSERIKRIIKSQSNAIQQLDVIMSPPASSHNIDTTPLESLPGNIHPLQQAECNTVEKRDENLSQESHKQCDFDKNNSENIVYNRNNNIRISSDDVLSIRSCEMDIDDKKKTENSTVNITPKRYTTATSTEELLSFSSTEVQTIPYEIHESESESNDEPIENLSILTKEILNRTDLQECIAENINKAIIPTDISFKDENLNESIEGNTSIMAELNTAIKSIVEATESDPVFEKFLDEIIGPHTETDTSPEEDGEGKLSPKSVNEPQEQGEPVLSNINSPEPIITDVRVPAENDTVDVPLKHRLRSSSRQQCNRIEDEVDKVRDQEKEQSALEDQNAAAILSIINANIINNASENDKRTLDDPKESVITNDNNGQKIQTMVSTLDKNDISVASVQKPNDIIPSTSNTVQSKVRKPTVKRPRATKPKRDQAITNNQPITEQEIMTMPTLILCSKEEVNNLLINRSSTIKSSSSRFIPIAPKDSNKIKETVETVYLKTVNVAQNLPIVTTQSIVEEANNFVNQTVSQAKNNKISKELKTVHKFDTTVPVTIINQQVLDQPQIIESMSTGKITGDESITLYGNETSAKTSLDGTNMPTINLEENMSISESGLSPYLKFNCKTNQSHNLSDIDLAPMMENARKRLADNDATEKQQSPNADIIAKRTPKSLLKSRSKNHRLSLSTPRKRSSHVRALDFSTPTMSSARKTNGEGNNTQFLSSSTKRLKSVCRTSLFRSPLSSTSAQKQKSPIKVCQPYRIPIATRSPAPKLMGGWDKYNGVGVIIGEVSPHGSASCSSSEDKTVQHKSSKALTGSWDADLRKSIQLNKKDEVVTKKPVKKRRDSIKEKNDVHMHAKYSPRSTKSKKRKTNKIDKKSNHDTENIEENETEENSQDNTYRTASITKENNEEENFKKTVVSTADSTTNKPAKVLKSASTYETSVEINSTSVLNSNTVTEKKPVKKYAQLKTITTNLRKSDDEMKKKTEDAQISEISRILSVDSTQHTCPILRLPDMISLETPRKFDNISGPPPTPRVLSPSSNIITPFVKISEDSSKIRSFITTPEFPITPCVALTPKEETTRDIIKKGEFNSSYYKPKSEQVQDSELSKPKESSLQESPIISSSHITLQSTHNSLTSGNTYQTSSKLEITQFEVIKENLPREEAIKELKIASSSKDSDLNASIVIDRHIDLIEINEFKGVSEVNDDNCVADSHNNPHNDSAESNSSSSSDTSSSSSSSSTSSSNTDTSTSGSSNCDKAQSKTSTDTSNDFAEKGINAPKNEQSIDPIDTCKKSDNDLIEQESSPQKVFAIAKTDDQIEATMKETPAKDEALLNEAVISETPSSSKSGMEHFTNLSTKISAIITEDEKLSKANKPSKDNNKIQVNKLKAKPKIISMQYIRPGSSKLVLEPIKEPVKENYRPEHDKVMQQLEEKRQRMIAKIKETKDTKTNLSKVTKRKCISNTLKKIGREKRKILPKSSLKSNANKDVNKNAQCEDIPQKVSTINTRKRYQQQKLNFVHKCCDNEEDRKKDVKLKNASNLINYENNSNKPLNDHTKKQSYKGNICAENNLVNKNQNKESESHKNSSSENQKNLKEKSNVKENTEKSCSVRSNSTKEEGEKFQDNIKNSKSSEQEVTSNEKHIVQKTSTIDKAKQEIRDQPEDKTNKLRHFASHPDKSECFKILRYKVDQVKRDLFSDEESDHRLSSAVSVKANKEVVIETENFDLIEIPSKKENVNPENPKQELSSVLQCLRLVPAYKNENLHNDENQIEQLHQEQNEYENKDSVNNELHQTANIHNYKAEYHFVHDDSAPIRKRRRRYSGHELQIQINHADVSDPNISSPIECIRIMKASEFEEIFNLAPKSKKRAISKRSPIKNDKGNEMDKDAFILKDNVTKPLATSSPVDKPTDKLSKTKLKKTITKTATTNRTDTNTQSEAKKKQKVDKHQEKVSDTTAKSRKRKLSETKETKQIEKKPCTIDPQMLLNNMNKEDLDNLLDKVHGPV